MADRVFGHALNTVNKIRPGSQKPPSGARLALYGLYKQAMEGDVALIADPPSKTSATASSSDLKRDQEKYDAWKANEGLSRTEAKRRYIEKLIDTMHQYASTTPEARELVEPVADRHAARLRERSARIRRWEFDLADGDRRREESEVCGVRADADLGRLAGERTQIVEHRMDEVVAGRRPSPVWPGILFDGE